MGFYEEISKYYDYIFPVGQSQLEFIKESAGSPVKKILDVACGSGGYSVELAKAGYSVAAVDLDDEMVYKAREKAVNACVNIDIAKCDMKGLESAFHDKFDYIFCIGNSIVHLGSREEIFDALKQMYNLLEDNGALLLQIINYDRIIKFNVSGLPVIKNAGAGLEFIRKYEYMEQKDMINFNTVLTVNNGDIKETYENSIELLPLRSHELLELLMKAGFREVMFFGDFNRSPYDENSYMLVVNALKADVPACESAD